MKHLKIVSLKKSDTHVVRTKKGVDLGTIYAHGEIFKRSRVFCTIEFTEWTSDCLRELANIMDAMDNRPELWGGKRKKKYRMLRVGDKVKKDIDEIYHSFDKK